MPLGFDVDVLDLGVLLESPHAELAANTALLVAAERRLITEDVVIVDPHRPGSNLRSHGARRRATSRDQTPPASP